MHQLIGCVQGHHAVQGNPVGMGNLACLASNKAFIDAGLDDVQAEVEKVTPRS